MSKVFNRKVEINVPADQVGLKINGLSVVGANNALYAGDTAKTAQNNIRGRLKLDVRPTGGTTEDYAFQIRSISGKTSGSHWGIDSETHLAATGAANIMGVRGVAVVDATYTATAVSFVGVYGQVRADGTVAGASFLTGLYGLVEASTAITATHVTSAWLDSHQANAVTGEHDLLYMSNNGAAQMDQAIYVYGGDKITSLMKLVTVSGMVADTATTDGASKKIKINIDGSVFYINAYAGA